jgi:hypothetical protein
MRNEYLGSFIPQENKETEQESSCFKHKCGKCCDPAKINIRGIASEKKGLENTPFIKKDEVLIPKKTSRYC